MRHVTGFLRKDFFVAVDEVEKKGFDKSLISFLSKILHSGECSAMLHITRDLEFIIKEKLFNLSSREATRKEVIRFLRQCSDWGNDETHSIHADKLMKIQLRKENVQDYRYNMF